MPYSKKIKLASVASAALLAAAFASTPMSSTTADAHGLKSKDSAKYSSRYTYRKKSRSNDRRHWRYSRRGRAVFANEVDLSRPGGPERFFELLNEEHWFVQEVLPEELPIEWREFCSAVLTKQLTEFNVRQSEKVNESP